MNMFYRVIFILESLWKRMSAMSLCPKSRFWTFWKSAGMPFIAISHGVSIEWGQGPMMTRYHLTVYDHFIYGDFGVCPNIRWSQDDRQHILSQMCSIIYIIVIIGPCTTGIVLFYPCKFDDGVPDEETVIMFRRRYLSEGCRQSIRVATQ